MFNKKILIPDNIKVIDALKRLDETADKVLFVVDQNTKLLGALTDGDIRRYLLEGKNLEDNISGVYNRKPRFILEKDCSTENLKKIFLKYKIEVIPILNTEHKLINLAFWDKVFADKKKVVQKRTKYKVSVVIMAGGKGTRLDPFTKILPKPLIPIGDKPIIELIMDRFHEYGMKESYVTVTRKIKNPLRPAEAREIIVNYLQRLFHC